MSKTVWLPFADRAEAERRLGPLPEGLIVDGFPSDGDWPESIGEVEFYVLSRPPAEAFSRAAEMTSLRVAQSLSAGYDGLLPHLPAGVTLCNGGGIHDTATAELALTLALTNLRNTDHYGRLQAERRWEPRGGGTLADAQVLIIGYGRIGAAIERRLAGFEVASVTRVARRARSSPEVRPIEELASVLPTADVVFCALPMSPATAKLINAEVLALLPDRALLINVGRGGVVDTDALITETRTGRLRAALDVTDPEPLPADHPLWGIEGVTIVPHVGGASTAYQPRADRFLAAQLRRFAADEPLENVIDV